MEIFKPLLLFSNILCLHIRLTKIFTNTMEKLMSDVIAKATKKADKNNIGIAGRQFFCSRQWHKTEIASRTLRKFRMFKFIAHTMTRHMLI